MVDPTDKDTKHNKDWGTGTEGYLEYTNEKKRQVNQLDVGNKKGQHNNYRTKFCPFLCILIDWVTSYLVKEQTY